MIDLQELRGLAGRVIQARKESSKDHENPALWDKQDNAEDYFHRKIQPVYVIELLDRLEAAEKVCDAAEIERSRWISVKDKLPEPPLYDWVLVQAKMVPEGWYGVPHIAELRHGVWYGDCYDEPLENCCSIEITHWMPLPEHPIVRNIKEAQGVE